MDKIKPLFNRGSRSRSRSRPRETEGDSPPEGYQEVYIPDGAGPVDGLGAELEQDRLNREAREAGEGEIPANTASPNRARDSEKSKSEKNNTEGNGSQYEPRPPSGGSRRSRVSETHRRKTRSPSRESKGTRQTDASFKSSDPESDASESRPNRKKHYKKRKDSSRNSFYSGHEYYEDEFDDTCGSSPKKYTFAWLLKNDEYVRKVSQRPTGNLLLIAQIQAKGDRPLSMNEVTTLRASCKAFLEAEEEEKRNLQSLLDKNLVIAEAKARDVYQQKALDGMYFKINEDQDLVPPEKFTGKQKMKTVDDKNKVDKAFKMTKTFSGKSTDMTLPEYLTHLTYAQNCVDLSEEDFLRVMLSTSTGEAHALIKSQIEVGRRATEVYDTLTGTYDDRIPVHEAGDKLKAYVASKNKTFAEIQGDITRLASRASQAIPNPGRAKHYDHLAYTSLCKALPYESHTRTLDVYRELSGALRETPDFNQLCKGLSRYEKVINLDVKRNGADTVPDTKLIRSRATDSKTGFKPKGKFIKNRTVNQLQASRPAQTEMAQSGGSKKQPTGKKKGVNSLQSREQPSTSQKGGKYYPKQGGSKPQTSGKDKICTHCGIRGHTAADGCRASFNDQGKDQPTPPTSQPCQVCLKEFNKELLHPSNLCPWREAAKRLYRNNARKPVGVFRYALEKEDRKD